MRMPANIYVCAVFIFAVLIVARALAVFTAYFYQVDEISLASGAASLVMGNAATLYHYTPQAGYYRLVEWIDLLLGGNINFIPFIMKGLSALAGAVIPCLGLFAFRNELTIRERFLSILILAANPIIWKSSQYGNTAIVACAFASAGLVILSNAPGPRLRILSLTLFGLGSLVRADTVLLAPLLIYLLYRNSLSVKETFRWAAAFGLIMATLYGGIMILDARADDPGVAIVSHANSQSGESWNQFWEYLVWSMSPILLIFAICGFQSMAAASRTSLFVALLLWCLPTAIFYFPFATIPRYLINVVTPLSFAAAVAVEALAGALKRGIGASLAWAAVLFLATVHLFAGLGHFTWNHWSSVLRGSAAPAQIGEDLPTGALLYRTYFYDPGVLAQTLPRPEFGTTRKFWEPHAFARALKILADPSAPKRTVVLLLGGGWSHAFHYHSQAAGAQYTYWRPRIKGSPAAETWFHLGNARVSTISWRTPIYDSIQRLDVGPGDEVWVMDELPFPDRDSLQKLPPGVMLIPAQTFDPHFQIFHVTGNDESHP